MACALVPLAFPRGEVERTIKITDVALAEQFVLKHRAQRRCDRHRELERHLVADEPLHHRDEREVTFRDGLEEPVFLQEILVLRMPNKRQMCVENEGERTNHSRFQIADLSSTRPVCRNR